MKSEGNKLDLINEGGIVGKNVDIIGSLHFSSEPYLITIGDNTTISFGFALVTHDAATRVIRHLPKELGGDPTCLMFGPITIGDNCFIGCRTTILAGVTIGNNTIIGAGSMVNLNIPDNVVAAGVPCKIICSLAEYMQKNKDNFTHINPSLSAQQKKELLVNKFKN